MSWIFLQGNFEANDVITFQRTVFSVSNLEAERVYIKNGAVDWRAVSVVKECDLIGTAVKRCGFRNKIFGQLVKLK